MAEDSSVSVPFSAINKHQNRELNPEAAEYIPVVQHVSSSSAFFYYQFPAAVVPYTLLSPPPPPSFYFRPGVPVNPPPLDPSWFVPPAEPVNQIFHHNHHQQQQRDQRLRESQLQVTGRESSSGRSRSWVGRWRAGGSRGAGWWRVKNGSSPQRSRLQAERNSIRNRVTSSGNEVQEEDCNDSNSWRMVKYRACKRIGMKFEIQQVDESANKTTVMIRNIPSRYTRKMMLSFLDRHCMKVNQQLKQTTITSSSSSCEDEDHGWLSAYDFFYMPMDFKTGLNKSYAFVNFTTPEAVWRFHSSCDGQKWELFQSSKIRKIALANLQGTEELIDHFGRTAFACDSDEFLPVHFKPPRDGGADVDTVTSIIGKRVSSNPHHQKTVR